jgi:lipooligosaccharide transport system permease protein
MTRQPISITARFIAVWYRNWIVYLHTWKVSFLPPLLEPILYIVAFGVGFKVLIPNVSYNGMQLSYVAFIAPALVASGIMNGSFFETTYSSFVRMYYQKTFDATMSAPVSVDEITTGEIVWGATRSLLTATIMLAVVSAFGLVRWPYALLIIPLAIIGGLGFGAVGMVFTGIVPNIDMFTLPTFLFITPMFLFSGTFFPLDSLPGWAQRVAMLLPLTHLSIVCREICLGFPAGWSTLWSLLYLVVFAVVFFVIALQVLRRRLIR